MRYLILFLLALSISAQRITHKMASEFQIGNKLATANAEVADYKFFYTRKAKNGEPSVRVGANGEKKIVFIHHRYKVKSSYQNKEAKKKFEELTTNFTKSHGKGSLTNTSARDTFVIKGQNATITIVRTHDNVTVTQKHISIQ